jgi:3-hydroxyisobutyrate dehydrogenase
MGYLMCSNLYKKGNGPLFSKISVFDVSQQAMERFSKEHKGVQIVANPDQIAKHSDIIITMLPSPAIVKEVYLGNQGLINSLSSGSLVIDSSTIDPATAKLVANEISQQCKVDAIDAPVSGGKFVH